MNRSVWIAALFSLTGLGAEPVYAKCPPGSFVQHKNGEDYCFRSTDSDYRPSTVRVTVAGQGARGPHTKAEQAALIAKRRARHLY